MLGQGRAAIRCDASILSNSKPSCTARGKHVQKLWTTLSTQLKKALDFPLGNIPANDKRDRVTGRERFNCGCAALESLFSTSVFFARMLAEGHTLTLTLSHPASSRASRDYAGTRRERELGCGCADLGRSVVLQSQPRFRRGSCLHPASACSSRAK